MDEHAIRKMLEGGGGLVGRALRVGLWLPGKAYGALMALRRAAYRRGLLASTRALVPTLSVGNLTAGGSGKTPFTLLLARTLLAMGRKPAILVRGYRQDADGVADEAVLYQTLCPAAPVVVNADRRAGAARATAAGADVLLMDDGFQHLKLGRDLDIVLVDATAPWGGGNTLPGGLLREPPTALRTAAVVVVTRSDQVGPDAVGRIRERVLALAPDALILTARHRPSRLRRLDGGELPLSSLHGRRVVALSGIARPEAFEKTLSGAGALVAASLTGSDHAHFDTAFLARALATAEREGAVVVITEKDRSKQIFAKLADKNDREAAERIWTLGIEQEVDDLPALLSAVARVLEKWAR